MNSRSLIFAAVAAALPIPDALAFVVGVDGAGNLRRWRLDSPAAAVPTNSVNRATKAIRIYLPTETANAHAAGPERNNLRAAFAQWQAIPGAAIRFEDAGLVSNGDINLNDGTNLVFFAQSELVNGGMDSIFNRGVALTYVREIPGHELAEADIVFNAFQHAWFSDYFDPSNTNFFIESTALHEIGHFLGFDHSPAGGATMFARSLRGVTAQSGLAPDEFAAARGIYPLPNTLGAIQGVALMNGAALFGAVVSLEDPFGNLVQSTVTQTNGFYILPALAPGNYQMRMTPLDPAGGSSLNRLIMGPDISPSHAGAAIAFPPISNFTVTVATRETIHRDLTAENTAPGFRITRIIPPAASPDVFTAQNASARIAPGTTGLFVGVAGPALPASGALLEISGPGITLGPTRFAPDLFGTSPPLRTIYASITVDPSATPGLRSFILRSGSEIAYANGFLEITQLAPDDNFDGLDDAFQRAHFPLFTSADAAPGADPDHDGAPNRDEHAAATIPTVQASVFQLEQIEFTESGARVRWQSVPGKRYQLWTRNVIVGSPWQAIGGPVLATGFATEQSDPAARSEKFYRVEVLP